MANCYRVFQDSMLTPGCPRPDWGRRLRPVTKSPNLWWSREGRRGSVKRIREEVLCVVEEVSGSDPGVGSMTS